MHSNNGHGSRAFWARGIAAVWAVLAAAAAGGALAAPVETVLYSFRGGPSDGANPLGGLIADSSGNLYGTTTGGGAPGCSFFNIAFGCGVVFKLSPSGTETVLHTFTGSDGGSDGAIPTAGLIADSSGNLYGTAPLGGGARCYGGFGCGVVFKVSPGGTETVLYSFKGGSDGGGPRADLIADSSGNLYGTTPAYGALGSGCDPYADGCGTVYKSSRRAGPIRCCTPLQGATGLIP